MKLTKEQIEKIAQLARLRLSEEEMERYADQLTTILNYVDMLKELDTAGVPETSQVTGLTSVTREDEGRGSLATPDELLACSPLEKVDHQIRIKRIM
ncbi:MAG: Asp-tRNA(Asn)/Glu-tRNA(Gln) amidotransferase subunit GatC [Candidatus Gracilibacteria bacterium]|jgi:aspartyl-tRNA(Asn)/glutamyl-tRNA(Gln) amidotransferase subunit C